MSREKLSIFRRWFIEEFDADAWDSQFEDDVLSGRLDALAEEAIRDFEEGRCTDDISKKLIFESGNITIYENERQKKIEDLLQKIKLKIDENIKK